ncbi:hypothetical protein ACJIZ3_022052 [Penstemon smallii]|uniref:non-specific serine/threonine protein kinase n=1 Tax=Penstemon smallii TaxID=265156 RepID=A0ABD3SNW7_9LAMI
MTIIFLFIYTLTFFSITISFQIDEFTYIGFTHPKTTLSLSDSAQINKNGILQLTSDTTKLTGHVFYSSPIHFKNSSFSTCFAFSIRPNDVKLGGGDGLTFAIAKSKDFTSALWGGHLGLFNSNNIGNFSNHIFAVEFDTYQNFEFGDMNDNHVGIDVNSLVSNNSASAGYFGDDLVQNEINLKSGKPILAWIEYDSITSYVNVTISPSSSKPGIPLLSFPVRLSSIFEENMYVGFSASTGLVSSSHYLLGWSFKLNGEAKSLDLNSLPSLPKTRKKHKSIFIISLSILVPFFVLTSILIVVLFLIKKLKNSEVIESWELEIGPHRYKYIELKKATRNFKESEFLGFGGFGRVYKGTLPNPKIQVAVKRISHESKQGVREFISEISSIGKFRHRNLVQLLGWCRRGSDLLLVYDFMPNGSLDKLLFDQEKCVLNWEKRLNIIKGVASGLLYLHEGYEQTVIHRDVKASNLYDHGSNPGTTRLVGTLGYLAPELTRTGRATTSCDVFAFGTLLLEIACGRRPIEPIGPDDLVLVDYVWSKWSEGSILDVVDLNLKGDFDENEVLMVLKLGLMCLSNEQLGRPSMRQVVSYLEGEVEIMDYDLRVPTATGGCVEVGGFEDYLHSYTPSSFEQTSSFTVLPKT